LLDKYALYLSIAKRNKEAYSIPQLLRSGVEIPAAVGWSVPGRAVVLPYAIGSPEGYAEFHVAKTDGCSSLLSISTNESNFRGAKDARYRGNTKFMENICGREDKAVRVPVLSLRSVLGWFGDRHVDFVKIDAQGYDLRAALSAGDRIEKIRTLELEVTGDLLHLPYEGAERCSEVFANLTALGFETPQMQTCKSEFHTSIFFPRAAVASSSHS
jgi:FkbM family methyltransferase